jgi:hypothetical protein
MATRESMRIRTCWSGRRRVLASFAGLSVGDRGMAGNAISPGNGVLPARNRGACSARFRTILAGGIRFCAATLGSISVGSGVSLAPGIGSSRVVIPSSTATTSTAPLATTVRQRRVENSRGSVRHMNPLSLAMGTSSGVLLILLIAFLGRLRHDALLFLILSGLWGRPHFLVVDGRKGRSMCGFGVFASLIIPVSTPGVFKLLIRTTFAGGVEAGFPVTD